MHVPPSDSAGWILFGIRTDLAADIGEIVWRRGERLLAVVDNMPDIVPVAWTHSPTLAADDLDDSHMALSVGIPQSTPGHRHATATDALKRGLTRFPPLVDPSAVVATTACLGRGTVVSAGAVIAAQGSIGEVVLVNRSASVGHHAQIADFASLGPGCVLAGRVSVGRGGFVGAGAVIAPGVSIGANATVGAGAVVVADVPARCVVVGNPARVVKEGSPGFKGTTVPEERP